MPQSMSQASLPVFEINLNALVRRSRQGRSLRHRQEIDPSVLLHSRLSPDMFDLTRQVQVATDRAPGAVRRVSPASRRRKYEDNETTIAQLKDRIAKTVAYLKTLDRKAIDASADREITFPLGPEKRAT